MEARASEGFLAEPGTLPDKLSFINATARKLGERLPLCDGAESHK